MDRELGPPPDEDRNPVEGGRDVEDAPSLRRGTDMCRAYRRGSL